MKSKSLLIFLFGFAKMLIAQDSLTVETVQDTAFTAPQYSSVYDDVFMNKKETKWLFKVDALGLLGLRGERRGDFSSFFYPWYPKIELEYEHKLNAQISLGYSLNTVFINDFFLGDDLLIRFRIGIEPRFYFNKKKLRIGKVINNLNGNYVSLKAFHSLNQFFEKEESRNRTESGLIASYGVQRRIFNRFYVDYQIGVGIGKFNYETYNFLNSDNYTYWFNNKFTIGLAFDGDKKQSTNSCDLFRCFEEEKSLWKFDIKDIFKSFNVNDYSIFINPEYERKIGKSSFSLNTGIGITLTKISNYKHQGYQVFLEPRYYYNLKKRIAKGKSANNLSGSYFSLNMNARYSKSSSVGMSIIPPGDTILLTESYDNFYKIEPRWGIQRRLFKNGFLDVSLSLISLTNSYTTTNATTSKNIIIKRDDNFENGFSFNYFSYPNKIPRPNMYFKIGLAF